MPAGLKRNFGSMTKPRHAGLSARSGITAVHIAGQGFTADPEALGSDRGSETSTGLPGATISASSATSGYSSNAASTPSTNPAVSSYTSIAGTGALV